MTFAWENDQDNNRRARRLSRTKNLEPLIISIIWNFHEKLKYEIDIPIVEDMSKKHSDTTN